MDIHKPKPWHGLREFLKEYVIIVVGVLTALGAEAMVENLHEARVSDEARAAVRGEITLDVTNMKRRADLEPCIARRLSELSDFVARAEAGQSSPPPLTIGAPGHPVVQTERWEAATAGARTSLLSIDEQRSFAGVYEQLRSYQATKPVEREVWGQLIGLEGVRRPSPELLARAREALGRARLLDLHIQRSFLEISGFAERMGVKGNAKLLFAQPYLNQPICLPLSTPPAEAARHAGGGIPLSP
jgi:hypothetical protein